MMSEKAQYDVVIVGGGIAGMIAANRAAQLNLCAVVLEQGAAEKYLCNTRYTGGTFHICLREIMLDEEILREKIVESTAGFVKPALAQLMAREGRRVVRWLQDEGIRFMRASASEYHKWVLAPPGRSRPGLDWEGRGGDVLLRTLESQLAARKGEIVRGARAKRLIVENRRCVGVVAERGGADTTYHARAVVIADGGFQGDAGLVAQYISKHPEQLKQRGAGTGRGDGVKMASAAGAALVGMDRFYGHMLSKSALTNDNLWPYPYLDSLVTAGIVVDATGHRFVDEGRGGVYTANTVARLDDPLGTFVVFDSAIWEKAGRNGLIPANPHLEKEGATIHRADTIEALAKSAKLPVGALSRTVSAYNEAMAAGKLQTGIVPIRQSNRYAACPVTQPPFYAVPACAGITNTMGGISVNEHAQALRADNSVVEGLYAAGAAAGGLEGGPEVGYVGGLSKGGVTGLVAAEHIAASIAQNAARYSQSE
jgi:fumarate reductase flavoprotein subunit